MSKTNSGKVVMKKEMDAITFEMEIIPIFNKFKIEKDKTFHIRAMDNVDQYESLFAYIYHGILYNFFLQVEKKEMLSYDEFLYLSKTYLSFNIFYGEKTVQYGETDVLTVSKYDEENGSYITPIYGSKINRLSKTPRIMNSKEKEDEIARKIEEADRFCSCYKK